ncbi:hypothetical protein GVAV_003423 [Gurleya vavrai]
MLADDSGNYFKMIKGKKVNLSGFYKSAKLLIEELKDLNNDVVDAIYKETIKKIEKIDIDMPNKIKIDIKENHDDIYKEIQKAKTELNFFENRYDKYIEKIKNKKIVPLLNGEKEFLSTTFESIYEDKNLQFFLFFDVFSDDKYTVSNEMFELAKKKDFLLPDVPSYDNYFDMALKNFRIFLLSCEYLINMEGDHEK